MQVKSVMPLYRAAGLIRSLGRCTVTFRTIKEPNELRIMDCLPFAEACDLGPEYILVYDLQKRGIRQIQISTIETVKGDHTGAVEYRITRPPVPTLAQLLAAKVGAVAIN